jgi:CHAT domain-containing protein
VLDNEALIQARSLQAGASSLKLGSNATETAVKQSKLDRYRVIHFATHGLLPGETARLARGLAEPALVLTPPDRPTEQDDGLLTASEIATLKLDADWVIMSACNTAAGGDDTGEALSGLARAFFHAGARALLVSHWPVNSYAASVLTTATFAELQRDKGLGRAQAFRKAMLAMIDDEKRPWAAHPAIWAAFVVVGEGLAFPSCFSHDGTRSLSHPSTGAN